jgi:hypothetical protein
MAEDESTLEPTEGLYSRPRRSRSASSHRLLWSRTDRHLAVDFAALDPHGSASGSRSLSAAGAARNRSELDWQRSWHGPAQACFAALRDSRRIDRRPRIDGQRRRHRGLRILETSRIYSLQGQPHGPLQINRGREGLDRGGIWLTSSNSDVRKALGAECSHRLCGSWTRISKGRGPAPSAEQALFASLQALSNAR